MKPWIKVGSTVPGLHWTVDSSVSHSEGAEFSGYAPVKLSQVLLKDTSGKYSLSPKACLGILRRAAKRGKKLPEMLELALREKVGLMEQDMNQQSSSDSTSVSETMVENQSEEMEDSEDSEEMESESEEETESEEG